MILTSEELCSFKFWRAWLSTFTIELAVMFSKMSHGVVGVLSTELAIAKVCQNELGHNETFCSDLSNHTEIEIEVQKRVNMFEMRGDLMCQIPTIFYAAMVGSLADRFGRKPLMITVITGQILEGLALLVNAIWFRELRLEYLWLSNTYSLLGGGAVWYLAVYGWAADITTAEERASRMARFDGFEQTAYILGNALSPLLFTYLGYQGAFGLKISLSFASLVIILMVVKREKLPEGRDQESLTNKLTDLALGMWRTIFKRRSGWVRLCILLQILTYTLYYFSFGSGRLWYLYVRKTHGWNQQEFIAAKVVRKTLGISILLILLPVFKRFNISDINLLIAFNALHGLGFLIGSLSHFSVGFLIAGILLIPWHFPKYSLARALLSQSVDKAEVGRIYSSLSLASVLVPIFSKPLYAYIYDQSMETFGGSFMVLTGLIIATAMAIMISVKYLLSSDSDQTVE